MVSEISMFKYSFDNDIVVVFLNIRFFLLYFIKSLVFGIFIKKGMFSIDNVLK